jgi:adenylate cyclase
MGKERLSLLLNYLSRFRIHLRIGIAWAFAMVMIPLTLGMVGYLYQNNANLARQTANRSMVKASEDIAANVGTLLSPVARVVEASSVLVRIDRGALRRPDGMRYFLDQMEKLPQIYSLFIGFGSDGSFYQVIRLPERFMKFGPSAQPVPEGSSSVLRILDSSSGAMADSFIYLAGWGDVRGVDRGPAKYDPRARPWYKAAQADPGVQISDVYTFASTGKPGLTVSKRAATESGVEIGAVGADITLDALSGFLAKEKIGEAGRVFIMDGQGRLIGHPDPKMGVRQIEEKIEIMMAKEVADSVVAGAATMRAQGSGDRFSAPLGPEGDVFMVSFTPFPKDFGKDWVIGIAVKELEFIGPLQESSLRILVAGSLVILVAVFAINWLAGRMTKPLQGIVAETHRIRRFDLEGELAVKSRIVEVSDLGKAVAAMKRSLRSFSVYVPKELVRLIVSSGEDIQVGGERRKLAVMFTDIKGFTQASEDMAPERVMESLSAYFREMSGAIHRHKGIVDKYIGDAIMALWNAPLPDEDAMGNACRAVLACHAAGKALGEEHAKKGLPAFVTRFGLHAGDVVVGNVGSADRMQYTALGAEVNLASRLEALNKLYGTEMLVSETVAAEVHGRFLFRTIDLVAPAGTTRPIAIYELVGSLEDDGDFKASAEDIERCKIWEAAFSRYAAHQWDQALDSFQAFAAAHPNDGPAKVFIERCKEYVRLPPPEDWDTAQRLEHK